LDIFCFGRVRDLLNSKYSESKVNGTTIDRHDVEMPSLSRQLEELNQDSNSLGRSWIADAFWSWYLSLAE
jgi:hypothetical protein